MKKILLLCDYKGHFGSKYTSVPYRSGMDKQLLINKFNEAGFQVEVLSFSEINFRNDYSDYYVLYTSTEDLNNHYKSYIEDVIYGLELAGSTLIPSYKYLRATNNKVVMEILRDMSASEEIKNISSFHFGCFEDYKKKKLRAKDWVYKAFDGAQSRGVGKGKGKNLDKQIYKISKSSSFIYDLKDKLRNIKHKGYVPESQNRNKFIVQDYVEGLNFDFKVLVYNEKFYVLKRNNRTNDFRASGSGDFLFDRNVPTIILDYAARVFSSFKVPNISMDIAFKGSNVYLLEFQCIYFGTTTIEKSPFYFIKDEKNWVCIEENSRLEDVYFDSIDSFLKK